VDIPFFAMKDLPTRRPNIPPLWVGLVWEATFIEVEFPGYRRAFIEPDQWVWDRRMTFYNGIELQFGTVPGKIHDWVPEAKGVRPRVGRFSLHTDDGRVFRILGFQRRLRAPYAGMISVEPGNLISDFMPEYLDSDPRSVESVWVSIDQKKESAA
jgi:hypothetical protein